MLTASLDTTATLGAQTYMLVSVWKPIFLMAPFVAWAWLVSAVFDKHAQRFYLGAEKWNAVHIAFAIAALALVVFIPIGGIAGFAAAFVGSILVLSVDALVFVSATNRDERVPERAKITLNLSKLSEKRAERRKAKQIGSAELSIMGPGKVTVQPPPKDTPELGVRVASEQVVIKGYEHHASQIDIVPTSESSYAVSLLVDGVRQAADPLPPADAVKIIDFWKSCAKLDLEDRRRKLTGFVNVSGDQMTDVRLKISTSGTKGGMKMTVIFNPAQSVRRSAENLGFLEPQMELVRSWADDPERIGGTVLMGVPPDNGRTTLAYALLKIHDAYTSNIQTIEYEIEDNLEGIKQIAWDASKDETDFATTVRSSLRRDPDVVFVCDLPDAETASNIANADLERSRVYLSIPSEDPMTVLQTYVKNTGDASLAAKGLRGLVVGRLLRVLCGNCKVPYQPSADMLKKLGLPKDKVGELYKKGGQVLVRNKPEVCDVCAGVGYQGQTGCYGVYPIEDEERAIIVEGNWNALRSALRKRGLPSIQQAALRKAVMGVTSIEEVTRITTPRKSSSSKKTEPQKENA